MVFQKIRETEQEVTYRFGHDETELDRELTISKAQHTVKVADGRDDPIAAKVAGTVLTRNRKDRIWLGGGGIQS